LCKKYSLFSALAHIFNRALDDFVAPAEALLQAAAVDAAAVTASGSGGGMGGGGGAHGAKAFALSSRVDPREEFPAR